MITTGNALLHGRENSTSGWFLGHFIPQSEGLRHSRAVEIKWGVHGAGERKAGVGTNQTGSTLALLISGRFVLTFPGRKDICLKNQGDYVVFGPGIAHGWVAIEDSLVITVRWPSIPHDQTLEV